MEKSKSIYFNLATRIITKIIITNTKLVNSTGFLTSEYILYIFKVITPFHSWYIKKRYSDINNLYDYLVFHNPKLKFPAFPPKRIFSTKESTILERKNGFEEFFFFILNKFEILNNTKLINFFHIKKILLVIYIKNCILVNENKYTYELLDIVNSSSSSSNLSQNSDDSIKNVNIGKNLEVKKTKNKSNKTECTNENNQITDKEKINENENEDLFNINENIKDNIDNPNNINIINETNDPNEKKNSKKTLISNSNYFRCYEDFKLISEKYTKRSQVSFLIIKEFLRNLKVHSSHIFEITNDFIDYLKYKKRWKKFNKNEIIALFIGIKKEELIDDYYQYIFINEKYSYKNSSEISEKTTLSNTPHSISTNSYTNSSNNTNNMSNIKNVNIIEDDLNIKNNELYSTQLEGLLYNIGKFQENYLGARNCLLLLSKFFEKHFNPEVDIYIKIFQKIDINYIKLMNLCKFCYVNNCINQKLCFNILNIYINGYKEEKKIKILKELNADDSFINKFFEYHFEDDIIFNSYNIE